MVLRKAWQDVEHNVSLADADSFDHEALIVRQKEETSTLPGPFACLEHLLPIEVGRERLLQHLQAQHVGIEQLSKLIQLVVRNLCLCVDDCLSRPWSFMR